MAKDKKEKDIETAIRKYLKSLDAVEEGNNGGQVTIKKGPYTGVMRLQTPGCPDITGCYMDKYFGIEVKKNQDEVDAWFKKEKRLLEEGELPKSYQREVDQIAYKQKILKNGGHFLLTCKVEEAIEFITGLESE